MNYTDSKLQSLLAAEYVLGSLCGAARGRFERLLQQQPGLRRELEYWQYRLNPLAETLQPVHPPKRVWKKIQSRIRNTESSRWIWNNLIFWRGAAFASMAALLLMSMVMLQLNIHYQEAIQYVAVLRNEQAQPMMVARMGRDNILVVDMLGPDNTGPDAVMEVWCVPSDGKPMSLGLLTTERGVFELNSNQLRMLHQAREIAISIEPPGGSPSGLPTGPVMYRGNVI